MNIIIVDSSVAEGLKLKLYLYGLGHQVTFVNKVSDVWEVFHRENNVDLVIASHELEGNINGWDFLHIVKKDKPLVHTILLHKFVKYYLCKIDHFHQQPVVLAPLEHYINNINKKAA